MTIKLRNGIFLAPFHPVDEDPTLCIQRDLELIEYLDRLGYEEAELSDFEQARLSIASARKGLSSISDSLMYARLDAEIARAEAIVRSRHDPRAALERLDLVARCG